MRDTGDLLYDPTAEPRILASGLAPRLASLEGKRVGILDNSKANAGTLMLAVVARLKELYGVRDVVKREKGIAGPPSPSIMADLTKCDFVLVGSADSGSCTSWSIHGAIVLEQQGIPTVVMGTFEFEQLAKLEARNRGLAELPLALIPHPLGGIREEEVIKKADLAIDLVVHAVTKR